MLNFPKMFKRKKQETESKKEDLVKTTPLEHNEQDSEEGQYGPPSANEGQVSIQFTGASPADGALLVGFFVSNGLSKKVKFESVPLVLIDSNRRVLARQSFDGETIGEIVGGSSKACVVRFLKDNVYSKDVPEECQVCFDVPAKPLQTNGIQYQTLPENITENQRQELERILRELPPMELGEVNFSPLNAQIEQQGDLLATVIIRNNTDKRINLEKIPLAVFDASKSEIVRGVFDIQNLSIDPFKAMLWTFNFGAVSEEKDLDLTSWHLNVVQ